MRSTAVRITGAPAPGNPKIRLTWARPTYADLAKRPRDQISDATKRGDLELFTIQLPFAYAGAPSVSCTAETFSRTGAGCAGLVRRLLANSRAGHPHCKSL